MNAGCESGGIVQWWDMCHCSVRVEQLSRKLQLVQVECGL